MIENPSDFIIEEDIQKQQKLGQTWMSLEANDFKVSFILLKMFFFFSVTTTKGHL